MYLYSHSTQYSCVAIGRLESRLIFNHQVSQDSIRQNFPSTLK